MDEGAPLSEWARGFAAGHGWLSESWEAYTVDELDEELGALMMVLSFFASREVAEAFAQEFTPKDRDIDGLAAKFLELFPTAMHDYAHLGGSIAQVIAEWEAERLPARSQKVGRNDPCPCGSGKKYKKCCGAALR
jgi:uncharacterized protein